MISPLLYPFQSSHSFCIILLWSQDNWLETQRAGKETVCDTQSEPRRKTSWQKRRRRRKKARRDVDMVRKGDNERAGGGEDSEWKNVLTSTSSLICLGLQKKLCDDGGRGWWGKIQIMKMVKFKPTNLWHFFKLKLHLIVKIVVGSFFSRSN